MISPVLVKDHCRTLMNKLYESIVPVTWSISKTKSARVFQSTNANIVLSAKWTDFFFKFHRLRLQKQSIYLYIMTKCQIYSEGFFISDNRRKCIGALSEFITHSSQLMCILISYRRWFCRPVSKVCGSHAPNVQVNIHNKNILWDTITDPWSRYPQFA